MKVFPAAALKRLPDGFSDTVQSMSDDELNQRILSSEEQIYKVDDDLATNEKILSAKIELKEMTAPYRDMKKQEQAKIMYCLFLMEQRGREIGTEE